MLNQIATYFEKMAEGMGLSIKIPRPSPRARTVCCSLNGIIGIAFIGTGAILKKPSLIILGAFALAGAALLSFDK